MKYSTALVALAATVASAQDISIFPECSLPCIMDGIGTTSCKATDFACVCKNMEAIKTAATPCVVDKCGLDVALNKVLPATEKFCADVDTKPPPAETTTMVTSTTTPPPATSSSSSEEEPEPTSTETPGEGDGDDEPTESSSAPGSIVTPGPSSIPTPPPANSSSTTRAAPAEPTSSIQTGGGVAAVVGSLGMMLLGAVAAL
ncbi:hypothetical protein C8A00DRAFT_29542 [Chaetomidium leptoderma]|uniref:CFEM domain-containing protein n=1 Tax=Chaetomidium leptoderma TaxID=669021 RepID=A0AAN7A123_9PEZI|nr:hypothetical protein C8A00DRAFT_29542 [Chaetomidium leptoderma]